MTAPNMWGTAPMSLMTPELAAQAQGNLMAQRGQGAPVAGNADLVAALQSARASGRTDQTGFGSQYEQALAAQKAGLPPAPAGYSWGFSTATGQWILGKNTNWMEATAPLALAAGGALALGAFAPAAAAGAAGSGAGFGTAGMAGATAGSAAIPSAAGLASGIAYGPVGGGISGTGASIPAGGLAAGGATSALPAAGAAGATSVLPKAPSLASAGKNFLGIGGLGAGDVIRGGLGAASLISGASAQGKANDLLQQAIDMQKQDYAGRQPFRDMALAGLQKPTPTAPNLGAIFADPGNPFARRPAMAGG